MYRHYKNGILAYGGGLLDQPNVYTVAMGIIDERTARIELEHIREASRKNAHGL